MKGNNDIKEALVHWPNDGHPEGDALGTLVDWTGLLEFKIKNEDGSHDSWLVGLIEKVKVDVGDDLTELHLRTDTSESLHPFISEIWKEQTTVKACLFLNGNCFYQELEIADFCYTDEHLIIELPRWHDIHVWPSGMIVDFSDSPGNHTPIEKLALDSVDFWEMIKQRNPEHKRPDLKLIKGGIKTDSKA